MIMIEKVARAIAAAEGAPHEASVEDAMPMARAALTALLGPSEAMVEAGWRANGDHVNGRPLWKCSADIAAEYRFRAMIQAALDETTP